VKYQFVGEESDETDRSFRQPRRPGQSSEPEQSSIMKKLLSLFLGAAFLTACDTEPSNDLSVDDTPPNANVAGDGNVQPLDPFPLHHIEITPGIDGTLVHITAFDRDGAPIGELILTGLSNDRMVTGSALFPDGGRDVTLHFGSESVQIETHGLPDQEIDRRLRMFELAIQADPLADGFSCGIRFGTWLLACSTTIAGCAVTGFPMACECMQWIEDKYGGDVFDGGICKHL
jgi:hypothetical protein